MAEKIYEIRRLTQEFYDKFDSIHYPEILHKSERPYVVMIAQIENNTFAIPFRTNINHNSGYKFSKSLRNTTSNTGLDFSKAVIVNDKKFIGGVTTIDNYEYKELNDKCYFIIKKFVNYLNGYKKYVTGETNEYISRKYKYTTLQYYHKELGITPKSSNSPLQKLPKK